MRAFLLNFAPLCAIPLAFVAGLVAVRYISRPRRVTVLTKQVDDTRQEISDILRFDRYQTRRSH